MLVVAAIVLVGIAVFIITSTFFIDEEQFKASEQFEDSKKIDVAELGLILKYSRPFFKRYASPIVGSMKQKKKIKDKYRRILASAGLSDYLNGHDFYAFKIFLIIGFPVLFLIIRWFVETDWPLSLIPYIAIFGYFYPDIWIRGRIKKRQEDIMLGMPFCVDMLALSVEAGMDFIGAMSRVVEKADRGPIIDEFEQVIKEIKIGSSRAEALRNMAWRVDLMQVSSFAATLIAADAVGASIGPILKALSKEIRQKKSAEVEKKGAKAATKLLLPTILLIVPSIFLVLAAPMVLEFLK